MTPCKSSADRQTVKNTDEHRKERSVRRRRKSEKVE